MQAKRHAGPTQTSVSDRKGFRASTIFRGMRRSWGAFCWPAVNNKTRTSTNSRVQLPLTGRAQFFRLRRP